jgi:HlyD family secretion protein
MKRIMSALQSAQKIGHKNSLKIIFILVLLAALWASIQHWGFGPEVEGLKVEQRDFVQTVVASGHVENAHRVDIGAQLTGTVKRVPVAEGQMVQAGQLLIELENTELQASLKQAEFNVQQAAAKLRQLREVQVPVTAHALHQAMVTQETSQQALKRSQDLYDKGFTGQAALDEFKRMALVTQSQVLSLKDQMASLNEGGSDSVLAQANLSQAKAGSELAHARLRYAQISAPSSGTLISRNVEPGDVVQAGKVLMVLSPTGTTELVVQIDEKHLSQLKIGQAATASADAYSKEQFPAVLSYINPGVDAQRGSVTVKLQVPQAPSYLQQDMTVSLNIEVAKRSQAILLATEAVRDIEKSAWVLQIVKGKAVRQPIQIGLRGPGYCEVLKGLQPNDVVIRDPAGIADNARVRIKTMPVKP